MVLGSPAQTQPSPPPITSCIEVRQLAGTNAAQGLQVDLRAIITFVDPSGTVFIQDDKGGTFAQGPKALTNQPPGTVVRVKGETKQGLFVPGINTRSMTAEGTSPLPYAPSVTYTDLLSGRHNYQRVKIQGTVRSLRSHPRGYWLITLAMGTEKLEVHVYDDMESAPVNIASMIEVNGLAAGFINNKRQLVAPHLRLHSFLQISPLPESSHSTVIHSTAAQLLQYNPKAKPNDRALVQGTVTHHIPGEVLFIQDSETGLLVKANATNQLNPGDLVEVIGFPSMGPFSAFLDDAIITGISVGTNTPPAEPATIQQILKGQWDARLINLNATLIEIQSEPEVSLFVFQNENHVFKARLPAPISSSQRQELPIGSTINLSGICTVEESGAVRSGFSSGPSSFSLQLRTLNDLKIITLPKWWTIERLTTVAASLALILFVALIWSITLQRRIRSQTATIREQAEKEFVLEERQRIAREFHDTLEQELVGLSLRLDAASAKATSPDILPVLETTRSLLARVQDEARHFVWNLREGAQPNEPLCQTLNRMAAERGQQTGVEMIFEAESRIDRYPGVLEHHIIRIAQEAVTNALKHAQPTHIRISLFQTKETLQLSVKDNGNGAIEENQPGHFGLQGMKERARKMKGELTLVPNDTGGITLTLRVPIEEAS